MTSLSLALISLLAGGMVVPAFAASPTPIGATVDETQKLQILRVKQDSPAASPDGSEQSPFPTITAALNKAFQNLDQGIATKVLIAPGLYREALPTISGENRPAAFRQTLLVIEGEQKKGVILSGADVLTNWKPVEGHPGLFAHDWTHHFGFFGGNQGVNNPSGLLAQRREMVFVDGRPLMPVILEQHKYTPTNEGGSWAFTGFAGYQALDKQVTDSPLRIPGYAGPGAKAIGAFGVVEVDAKSPHHRKLLIKLPAGADPAKLKIEAAVRPVLVRVWQKDSVVLRNLELEYTASKPFNWGQPQEHAAVVIGIAPPFEPALTTNILLENVHVRWSSLNGLALVSPRSVTVRDSSFNYCGSNGISSGYVEQTLLERVEFSHNDWRNHVLGGGWGWAAGGFKTWCSKDCVFRDIKATYNGHGGFWTDGANLNNRIEGGDFSHNGTFGIWIEISPGPTLVTSATMTFNGWRGLMSTHSSNLTVEKCTIVDNGLNPIGGQAGDYFRLGTAQVYVGHSGDGRNYEFYLPYFVPDTVKEKVSKDHIHARLRNVTVRDNVIGLTPAGTKAQPKGEQPIVPIRLDGLESELHVSGNQSAPGSAAPVTVVPATKK